MKIEINLTPNQDGLYTGVRYFENKSSTIVHADSPSEACEILTCFKERKPKKINIKELISTTENLIVETKDGMYVTGYLKKKEKGLHLINLTYDFRNYFLCPEHYSENGQFLLLDTNNERKSYFDIIAISQIKEDGLVRLWSREND